MKKLLCLFLAFQLLTVTCVFADENDDSYTEGNAIEIVIDMNEITESDGDSADIEPFIPEGSEVAAASEEDRVIVGSDNRWRIYEPDYFPYSAIAYMKVTTKCGCRHQSTGCMVEKNIVLTACTNLYCHEHNSWASGITFYFGYDHHDGSYVYKYNDSASYWHGNYQSSHDMPDNFAYIRLNNNVGNHTGWFGLSAKSDDDLLYSVYTVTGYDGGKLMEDSVFVSDVHNKCMFHDGDVVEGGSPVYTYDNYVVGITTGHYADHSANIATKITSSMINGIRDARDYLK